MKEHNQRFDCFSVNLVLDQDGDWIAHFAELPEISACEASPEQALHELENAWKLTKESYIANNKPIPVAPYKKLSCAHISSNRSSKILGRQNIPR